MSKYFTKDILDELNLARKNIYSFRTSMYEMYKIDILDTDALSALSIYEIVSQYDSNYNINFSRNGEDAKSGSVLIEQKAARVDGPITSTGKPRKNAGRDATFLFHAMGDIKHQRYIFVARNKNDLTICRLYDILQETNNSKIFTKLLEERNKWLSKGIQDNNKMKHDVISINESFLLEQLALPIQLTINNCQVYKDW